MKFRYLDNAEGLHTSTLGLCRIAIGLVSERGLWEASRSDNVLSRDAGSQYLEVRRITDAAPKILSWVLSRQGTC